MQSTEAIIGYLNETRERIGLKPVGTDADGNIVLVSVKEAPVSIGSFFKSHTELFRSSGAARWHLSQRKTNGMLEMGACVELPSKAEAEKARIVVFPSILIRWCQGERPWCK